MTKPDQVPTGRRQPLPDHAGVAARNDVDTSEAAGQARRRYRKRRAWSSRILHGFGLLSSHSGAGLLVAGGVVAWLVIGAFIGFPGWWENTLYITSSLTTLIMVFAVQHTQARQSAATQRKLDELLRALPTADNQLIAVEEVSERELQELSHRDIVDRESATADRPTMSPSDRPWRDR